ncbi:MAG: DUF2788 domain-containing protein [Pseudomonadota bacterium]|nr:DUF2788 domain-containing protein [Pseudomonadota bacterium]
MSEAEFASLSLKIGLPVLIGYMMFIVYRMGKDSRAGKFGMLILFIALGAGFFSFSAKSLIKLFIGVE